MTKTSTLVSDPIADMLTRIRNGLLVKRDSVQLPASNEKVAILRVLKDEGFIRDFEVQKGQKSPQGTIRVHMAYRDRHVPVITGLTRVSKPGLRQYVPRSEVPRGYGGLGIAVLSTSQGVMTGREAYRRGIGGEVLCYVW